MAGDGTCGDAGDEGPAALARIDHPAGIAVRGDTIYFVDWWNDRVRRLDGAGIVHAFAGTGGGGPLGDGGPATAASLASPYGVAVGPTGVVYIADNGHHRVRAVDAAGFISTVAGSGVAGCSGSRGPATAAHIYGETALSVAADAAGNVFVSETNNLRVRALAFAPEVLATSRDADTVTLVLDVGARAPLGLRAGSLQAYPVRADGEPNGSPRAATASLVVAWLLVSAPLHPLPSGTAALRFVGRFADGRIFSADGPVD